ncbi:hypothetical protein [Halomonas sp. HL-93]|uniref:hypothetical protein n=1 Tax=Halomonas sp. HL-93 TaxID=1666906 RepID=UPI0012E821A1|nr:hypothetical protein [Halomonas sp. HL-93]
MIPSAWALDDEAQAAKKKGMRLYNAHQRSISTPYLEQAAEAGDVEAMHYLGEVNRLRHMGMNQAALDWYCQAAQHEDPYDMLQLFDAAPASRPDLMAQSVPGYGDSYTAEPEDVNAYGPFPNKADRFVERGEAKDASTQNKPDSH